jgi:hypothetical protein
LETYAFFASEPLSEAVNLPLCLPVVPGSGKEPWNDTMPVRPFAFPVALAIAAAPWNVTVTAPLVPLEHPVDLDVSTRKVSLPPGPARWPVPERGNGVGQDASDAWADPDPATVPLPMIVAEPVPETELTATAPVEPLMTRVTVPEYFPENAIFLVVAGVAGGVGRALLVDAATAAVVAVSAPTVSATAHSVATPIRVATPVVTVGVRSFRIFVTTF